MSCAFSHLNPVPFHENLAHLAVGASSFANLQPQFPQEHFLHGKSPRLISASWETLERLPRMSPPTSESITTHLLSNTSSSSAAASAAASYLDSVFYKVICTPEFLKSAKENYIQPMLDTEFNQIVLPVECGKNCAFMYLTRLCQGSKGPCILFNACYWLTPNEFQSISGRNSAKDWKRSIRHNGKSIKLLINKGILTVHSPLCDCAYGSGIEPFVEKYSSSSSASPPIIASPSLDTQSPMYGVMDSECSHSDATGGASEDDPDQEEKFSPCTSDGCMTLQHNRKEGHNTRDLQKGVISSSSSSLEGNSERYGDGLFGASESYEELGTSHVPLKKAAESQGEESSSLSVSNNKGSSSSNSNGDSQSERVPPPSSSSSVVASTPKSKRKPSSKQIHQHKPSSSSEQQSPTHLSSTTSSPPMTPPPPSLSSLSSSQRDRERDGGAGGQSLGTGGGSSNNNNNNHNNSSGGSSPPQQPIKQMEQMMTASSRNYSEFMRSLAAKYNQQQSNHNNDYFPNLSFDTRFLKPAAAAAFLNLSQLPSPVLLEKDKFPLIDMSSTQTLLSMVRSASAAAAAAAVTNNNNSISNNNNNHQTSNECFKSGGGTKRPNSPLDLSSRDNIGGHPLKKTKLKTPIDLMLSAKQASIGGGGSGGTAVCMSSCATGCSEEAQAMINWNVEEVCQFVATIDLCKDYVEIFRENSIDGTSLPLLTEEHLMTAMNMRLGPALKFRSTVAKRLGNCVICSHCTHCHNHNNN